MYSLRPYQQEAVNNTIKYFKKKKDPGVIVLPTGAGKSLVIAELARVSNGRVLVLAHIKELVEQNHLKYQAYGIKAGVYSAGLNQKDSSQKVIFGSIQSVTNADDSFFNNFSLLVIDECHRVSLELDTQYQKVITKLRAKNKSLYILGLTATPYRLGVGWIYNYNHLGIVHTQENRFFKQCVYELSLEYMIKNKYLTTPVRVDIPVTCYDFSELTESKTYTNAQIEWILQQQRRLTPLIIKNIIDITNAYQRQGVMIFCSTVKHAEEIMANLPKGEAHLVLGETKNFKRSQIIEDFKNKKFKYLVNVSVLTTGFDAPHVDVISILRPTESVSLYQQIIGRGLRLSPGKKDCFILDYTGMGYDIYSPEIGNKKTTPDSVPVQVSCPKCGFYNDFWGRVDLDGNVTEHFGQKCKGAIQSAHSFDFTPCGYRFRFKICNQCSHHNDITACKCTNCESILNDASAKLKQARLSKNTHILQPDSIQMLECTDKNGSTYLKIKYYDYNAEYLSETHFINNQTNIKKFNINFLRSHMKRPEMHLNINSVNQVVKAQRYFRMPAFIIARKQDKFWKITEKIFIEEL